MGKIGQVDKKSTNSKKGPKQIKINKNKNNNNKNKVAMPVDNYL